MSILHNTSGIVITALNLWTIIGATVLLAYNIVTFESLKELQQIFGSLIPFSMALYSMVNTWFLLSWFHTGFKGRNIRQYLIFYAIIAVIGLLTLGVILELNNPTLL